MRPLFDRCQIELVSADLWNCLLRIGEAGIQMDSLHRQDELTASFSIRTKQLDVLQTICKKENAVVHVSRMRSILRSAVQLSLRPVLLLGWTLLLILTCFLPTRILFIDVEGNQRISSRLIAEKAAAAGIVFGANRRDVRSEQIKNKLLSELPELDWAGINTTGCTAVISVRERAPTEENAPIPYTVSSIVAERDAVITSCTAVRGNLLCREGQPVTKGEVLISAYTNCGRSIQACRAEGEIYGRTQRQQEAVMSARVQQPKVAGTMTRCGILLGKKRIKIFGSSRILDASCGRMYEQSYLTLPGGFILPFGFYRETILSYRITEDRAVPEEALSTLKEGSRRNVLSEMSAGKILHENTVFEEAADYYKLTSQYICNEMIGRSHIEQIGA